MLYRSSAGNPYLTGRRELIYATQGWQSKKKFGGGERGMIPFEKLKALGSLCGALEGRGGFFKKLLLLSHTGSQVVGC